MPLRVIRRKDTGALTITGTVKFPDGSRQRIRTRAQSNSRQLAEEEAADLEARLFREAWHGKRHGAQSFGAAVNSYLDAAPRSTRNRKLINRLLRAIGNVSLSAIDQDTVTRAKEKMLRPTAGPATWRASVVTPLKAILNHAAERGWCDPPKWLKSPKVPGGRTLYLLPQEAERLIAAAAPHLKPLLTFLVGTGARMSEAIELDWRDVDLTGARVILWVTKAGRPRRAILPPRVVTALANLDHRDGQVFRWETKRPTGRAGKPPKRDGSALRTVGYADRQRLYGGHIKTAWRGALKRAGLDQGYTPHDLRHTWASWHYAIHKDLLALKIEGSWSSIALVERYAHLMPAGHEHAICAFLGHAAVTRAEDDRASA